MRAFPLPARPPASPVAPPPLETPITFSDDCTLLGITDLAWERVSCSERGARVRVAGSGPLVARGSVSQTRDAEGITKAPFSPTPSAAAPQRKWEVGTLGDFKQSAGN